jgi:hypothetical protein
MESIVARVTATLLGLLALVGVSAGAYNGFQNSRAARVHEGITQIITNARAAFSMGSNGYTNMTTANQATLISAGLFPADWVNGANVRDPWGNAIALASANSGSQGVLTVGGGGSMNTATCTKAVQALRDYVTLKVGTTDFTPTTPPDATSGATACGTSGTVSIVITFQ